MRKVGLLAGMVIGFLLIFIFMRPITKEKERPLLLLGRIQYLPLVRQDGTSFGLAWADFNNRFPNDGRVLPLQWFYTWSPCASVDYDDVDATFVPMVWYAGHAPGSRICLGEEYGDDLLFLNEPELATQANTTPAEAVVLYRTLRQQHPNANYVGPCLSHIDYQQDWVWLREFYEMLDEAQLPPPDEACFHTYMFNEHPRLITDSLFALLAEFDGPQTAWVTEFAACELDWVDEAIDYWQADDRITHYAWFTVRGWDRTQRELCFNLFFDNLSVLNGAGRLWVSKHQ